MKKHDEANRIALDLLRKKQHKDCFASPLEFLLDEHMRQRALFGLLDNLSVGAHLGAAYLEAVICFLKSDFALHVLDEEEDLFPLLRRRVNDDGQLEHLLGKLSSEHIRDRERARLILIGLNDGAPFSIEFLEMLRDFSGSERRHLIVENAIIIPLARACLSETDLVMIGVRMAARRGMEIEGSLCLN